MTNEQIHEILKEHSLWLNSHGQEGKRANLSRACVYERSREL